MDIFGGIKTLNSTILLTRRNDRYLALEINKTFQDGWRTGQIGDHIGRVRIIAIAGKPGLAFAEIGESVQFMRQGYYAKDPDSTEDHPVFNLTVALRDSWAKVK